MWHWYTYCCPDLCNSIVLPHMYIRWYWIYPSCRTCQVYSSLLCQCTANTRESHKQTVSIFKHWYRSNEHVGQPCSCQKNTLVIKQTEMTCVRYIQPCIHNAWLNVWTPRLRDSKCAHVLMRQCTANMDHITPGCFGKTTKFKCPAVLLYMHFVECQVKTTHTCFQHWQ